MALSITHSESFPSAAVAPKTAIRGSRAALWTGRVLTGLASTFLIVDGAMKLFKPQVVVEATRELGYPEASIVGIGLTLLASTILYLIPRTSVLGAILLTGYLGGAVATHVRVGAGAFNVLFPVLVGTIVWAGLTLRNDRVRCAILNQH